MDALESTLGIALSITSPKLTHESIGYCWCLLWRKISWTQQTHTPKLALSVGKSGSSSPRPPLSNALGHLELTGSLGLHPSTSLRGNMLSELRSTGSSHFGLLSHVTPAIAWKSNAWSDWPAISPGLLGCGIGPRLQAGITIVLAEKK